VRPDERLTLKYQARTTRRCSPATALLPCASLETARAVVSRALRPSDGRARVRYVPRAKDNLQVADTRSAQSSRAGTEREPLVWPHLQS